MRRNKSKILAHSITLPKRKGNVRKEERPFLNVDRICIYARNGGVGDILMLTAPLRLLRKKYPDAYIELAIHTNGANDSIFNLINPIGIVDKVSNFRYIRKERFGTFVDVSVVAEPAWEVAGINLRSRIAYYAELLGVSVVDLKPFIGLKKDEKLKAKNLTENKSKVFFLDTSSIDDRRCIPGEVIEGVIDLINKNYKNHLIFVSDWRKKIKNLNKYENVIDVSNLPLREVASLIEFSDVFFGPDSALMHLSAAVETKSIVAFGMIPPEFRISTYKTHEAITVEVLSCLGCWYKPCFNNLKCMKDLDPYKIFKKISGR